MLTVKGEPIICAMYKVGDDLRQDSLTLQMVRIMDKMWQKNGLDLKMVTFACVPTGPRRGFVELITGAETLRRIQVCFPIISLHFEHRVRESRVLLGGGRNGCIFRKRRKKSIRKCSQFYFKCTVESTVLCSTKIY